MKSKIMAFLACVCLCAIPVMAGDITPASKEDAGKVQTAQVVTNGQAVTIGQGLNILIGAGGAALTTNTITLVAPTKVGQEAIIVIGSGSNLVTIADSGTAALSAAFLGDTNDTLRVISVSTSVWSQISTSNN